MRQHRASFLIGLGALASALAWGCGRNETPATPPTPPSATASAVVASDTDAEPPEDAAALVTAPPAPPANWVSAVSLEQWDEAARSLDALSEAEKARPEIRYVRARAALARGQTDAALPLLAGLEVQLPLLADEIAQQRAEAKLKSGPFAEAAEYFSVKGGPSSWLKAAHAYNRAKNPGRVRAMVEHLLGHQKRSRAQEAEGRALRFSLLTPTDKPGEVEINDARWLAVHAPDLAFAATAAAASEKLDPRNPLTGPELMTRAKLLGDAGKIDEALRTLDEVGSAPGIKVPYIERHRAKGYTLYRSKSRYLEAAKVLHECAAVGGTNAAEDAFHAARSLSRADKDDDAIKEYDAVARRYATSPWGDQAAYFVPYLHILHGEWEKAARGFDAYVKKYPDGHEKKDAARNRAIAHLMRKDFRTARALFEKLAGDEHDALTSARYLNMAALAALGDGDRTHALAQWTEVARTRPLSYAALVARARLTQHNAPLPPPIDPTESGPPAGDVPAILPPPADVLHRVGLDGEAEQAMREREPVINASAMGRSTEALCSSYGVLARSRRRFQVSQQIPSLLLSTAPGPRNRWAWECTYPMPYKAYVNEVEAKERLLPGLVYAVMRQESGYDPDAVSPARAVGLLQLMPETAKTLADAMKLTHEDARLVSPPYNITLGARFLHDLLERFKGQVPLAVASYNCGPEAVARWATRSPDMDLDVFVERIPYKETRDYVGRVMGNFARYAYLEKGNAESVTVRLSMK